MARKRPYDLLCPIARALDMLGDRWTLLILRDLHAGPARFGDLERGLGMAPNLLTQRLGELTDGGLIERIEVDRRASYQLTELGGRTDLVLWELSRFGAALPPNPEPRPAGNLRTVVLPLRMLFSSVEGHPAISVRLLIDDEIVSVRGDVDEVTVSYGPTVEDPDLVIATDYPSLLAVGEGRMDAAAFVANNLEVIAGEQHLAVFLAWFASGVDRLG
ncbi:MAG: winged helix-turn-helix transcriptional regulator [Acidimicrobiales bacterium]